MFSDKSGTLRNRMLVLGAGVALSLGMVATASAQSVVVRSTGPSAGSYPQGKKLAANATVSLQSNDRVTVLDKAGTRVLSGPGTFTLDGRVVRDGGGRRIASFLSSRSNSRSRTGAVRGAGAAMAPASTEKKSPNLWFVDVSKPGKYCVVEGNSVVLWRPEVSDDWSGQLAMAGSSAMTPVSWRRGNALELWPAAEVPISGGSSYSLSMAGEMKQITMATLPTAPTDLDQTAEMLIANGCAQQLDLLVDTLIASDASAGAGAADS